MPNYLFSANYVPMGNFHPQFSMGWQMLRNVSAIFDLCTARAALASAVASGSLTSRFPSLMGSFKKSSRR
jgi:hypothetical protein